jgi:hypothetical protein
MSEQNQIETALRVTTGKVRLSFPYLFNLRQPTPGSTGGPKYSVMLLIPKSDKKTMAALRAAEKAATEIGKNTKFGGKATGLAPSIIKDGDADGSAEDYPEREGHYYMTVNAYPDFKPEVVDRALQPILDQSEVYSGVYARVSVTAFAYKFEDMKKGVSFGLNNVQILGGGESLAGGKPASADFEAIEDEEEQAEESLL